MPRRAAPTDSGTDVTDDTPDATSACVNSGHRVAFDRKVVAYMALRGSYIDRLYVDPYEHRMGWGTRLLEKAKEQVLNVL